MVFHEGAGTELKNSALMLSRVSDEDMMPVTIVNKSKYHFVDMFNGRKRVLRPNTQVNVPSGWAKHWLGDPNLFGKDWGYEIDRLRSRHGEQFELIASGQVYCMEFGTPTSRYNQPDPEAASVIYGVPIEEDGEFADYDPNLELGDSPLEVATRKQNEDMLEDIKQREKNKSDARKKLGK